VNILWLSGYSPWPADHGGKIRLYNLVQQMLQRGHRVDLWCVCVEPVRWSGPPPPGLTLKHYPRALAGLGDRQGGGAPVSAA